MVGDCFTDCLLNKVIWNYNPKPRIFLKRHPRHIGLQTDSYICIWQESRNHTNKCTGIIRRSTLYGNCFRLGKDGAAAIAWIDRGIYQKSLSASVEPILNTRDNSLSDNYIIPSASCKSEREAHSEDAIPFSDPLFLKLLTSKSMVISVYSLIVNAVFN